MTHTDRKRMLVVRALILAAALGGVALATGAPSAKPHSIDSLPTLGQFDHMTMGIFNPVPEDFSATSVFGLPYTEGWLVAMLRNSSGKHYKAFMTIHADGTADFRVQATSVDGVILDPRFTEQKAVAMNRRFEPGVGMRLSLPNHEVTLDAHGAVWKTANGTMDLKARVATAAMHYVLPWRESDGKSSSFLYYTSQYFLIEGGSLFGEPVKGFLVLDQAYSKTPYAQTILRLEGSWTGFSNEYDDGTIEMGHFVCGLGAMRAALITDGTGREIYNSPDINLEITPQKQDANNPDRILFKLGDGERWQYIHNPEGDLDMARLNPNLNISAYPITRDFRTNAGRVTRLGEKRKVIAWWADTELNHRNLCAPRARDEHNTNK